MIMQFDSLCCILGEYRTQRLRNANNLCNRVRIISHGLVVLGLFWVI